MRAEGSGQESKETWDLSTSYHGRANENVEGYEFVLADLWLKRVEQGSANRDT
jgi:hypothetical protein